MSNNSFEQFFYKCNKEHRIPSSSEIFDELKNCGIFEGTELRKRDVANLMAVSVLIKSIWEFMFSGPYNYSTLCYSQIPEITGGLGYFPCLRSIGALMLKAFEKWSPECGTKIHPNAKAIKNASRLDIIFNNLKAYLEEKGCTEDCEALKMYAVFKSYCMIPDIQNLAISYAAMFEEGNPELAIEGIFQVLNKNEPLVRTK